MSLLKVILLPSSMIALLLIVSSICMIFRRLRPISFFTFVTAAVLYLVFSSGWTAAWLLSSLEYRYPKLTTPADYPAVKHIVVLTAYVADDPLMPLSAKFNSNTVFRILETYNIYSQCQGCTIIVSGTESYAKLMREQLLVLGVPPGNVLVDGISGHTVDSAESLVGRLEQQQFFLVTSAGHMSRAVGVMKKQGFEPVPAPTDYSLPRDFTRAPIWPNSQHLYYSDLAINEHAGIFWYRYTGRME